MHEPRPRRLALYAGAALLAAPLTAAAQGSADAADAPGRIAPRVARFDPVQDDPARDDRPVPDAALDAPGDDLNEDDAKSPGTRRVPRALPGVRSPDPLPLDPAPPTPPTAGPAFDPSSVPVPDVRITPRVSRDEYRAAYHAVPFSLAEHRANPGYRHAAAMKFLTGDYPPPTGPIRPAVPAVPGPGVPFGGGFPGSGGFFGNAPARGFPGLAVPGLFSGPPTVGPPPFAFDRVQGVVPTFVNRYRPPAVFLPRR